MHRLPDKLYYRREEEKLGKEIVDHSPRNRMSCKRSPLMQWDFSRATRITSSGLRSCRGCSAGILSGDRVKLLRRCCQVMFRTLLRPSGDRNRDVVFRSSNCLALLLTIRQAPEPFSLTTWTTLNVNDLTSSSPTTMHSHNRWMQIIITAVVVSKTVTHQYNVAIMYVKKYSYRYLYSLVRIDKLDSLAQHIIAQYIALSIVQFSIEYHIIVQNSIEQCITQYSIVQHSIAQKELI